MQLKLHERNPFALPKKEFQNKKLQIQNMILLKEFALLKAQLIYPKKEL